MKATYASDPKINLVCAYPKSFLETYASKLKLNTHTHTHDICVCLKMQNSSVEKSWQKKIENDHQLKKQSKF